MMLDPTLAQQLAEGVVHGRVAQAASAQVHQQRCVRRVRDAPLSALHVLTQGVVGGRAQRHPAGFAKLALGNVQALLVFMEVFQVQGERLADAEARAGQQSQQGPVSLRAERSGGRQLPGGGHQPLDLGDGVEVMRAGVF